MRSPATLRLLPPVDELVAARKASASSSSCPTVRDQDEKEDEQPEVPAEQKELKSMHDTMKKDVAAATNMNPNKPPLPPEIQKLTDEFWSKYTPASMRTLLLADQNIRVKNVLFTVSALLFTVPVGVMYLTQAALAATLISLDGDSQWIISAVVAVFSVNVILACFSYVAYCDECKNWADKQKLQAMERDQLQSKKKS
ncbi:unnamed protein product [Amoebophrya sp. A25]|nr:unnamed protein product [Amoebophrya sp. A25]|eukprot:GSA25T00020095001.1